MEGKRGTLSYSMACNSNGHRHCAERVAHSGDNAPHKEANDALRKEVNHISRTICMSINMI